MSNHAIRVDGLSKQYRIGSKQQGYKTLRDTLVETFVSPFRRAQKLLSGQAYGAAELGETIWALKDVSCEIKRGEVVGIIGPNGAGKTTLLKILSRITEPSEGQAEIRGRVGSLLEVGTGFHPELTGRENIYLNGAILGMKKAEIEQKFDEIVSFAEIEKFIDTPVKHYSSGMYVRLAFAVAAHLEPEILLVDEVLAVGDAAFQKKCLGKMENVAKEGRTVLFVSHSMAAIQRLCTGCILLDLGEIVTQGNSSEVIERYLVDSKTTRTEIDLYNLARERNLGTRARISAYRLYDSAGNLTDSIAFGEPFTVELACKALKRIEDVSFLVGIDSLYEQRIVTVTSLEDGKIFFANPGDMVRGRLKVNTLLLKPGIYSLTLGLFATNMGIDRVPDASRLEISDVSYSKEHMHISQITVGMIQMIDPEWEIVK
jgi:lipopolysaccharide transport system ATP-binding protein